MEWVKRHKTNNIEEIVSSNTGMSVDELLNDPKVYHYNNLPEAVDLFLMHVKKGSRIGCFCDYDTDGITSENIMKLLASALRLYDFKSIVPGRFSDGYGIKERHIDLFKGFDLLVLCDNGIAAAESVEKARALGIDVIILDHHQARRDEDGNVLLPPANVIVDPHITGGDFEDLCGAGISYRFAEECLNRCHWMTDKQRWFFLSRMSCFAALGTVGDVVSLTYDNRKIVKEGLKNLNKGYATTGLKVLCQEVKIHQASSTDLGYFLSPVVNAAGRMEDGGPRFISSIIGHDVRGDKFDSDFLSKCHKAVDLNTQRKEIEAQANERAFDFIENTEAKNQNFIVLVDPEITTGIAGLVSGKVTEKYNRPSIVLTKLSNTDCLKGSGRSVPNADLKAILDKNASLIEVYGGHPQACGITIKESLLADFIKAVNETAPMYESVQKIFYDVECTPDNAYSYYQEIEKFEPYGEGNPSIKVFMKGVELDHSTVSIIPVRYMGSDKQHVKLITKGMEFVWFNHSKDYKDMGEPEKFDVIGSLGVNCFNGVETLQMTVEHLRVSK